MISIDSQYLPVDNAVKPGPNGYAPPPPGTKPLTRVTPEIAQMASSLLSKPFGFITEFTSENKKYLARIEPHFHPQGHKGPNGWHKGCTVYSYQSDDSPRVKMLKKMDSETQAVVPAKQKANPIIAPEMQKAQPDELAELLESFKGIL
jgi:hypothetical protein